MIEQIHSKACLVFGCGNPLFGDDGFGPKVIEHLDNYFQVPSHIACIDIGTSIRDVLFDILLSANRPRTIVIIDAAQQPDKQAGEIFELALNDIHQKKTADFSLHQFPTTNMLKELKEFTQVNVRVLAAQVHYIPPEIKPGLSDTVQAAIVPMCQMVMEIINKEIPC